MKKLYTPKVKIMLVPYQGLGIGSAYIREGEIYEIIQPLPHQIRDFGYNHVWFREKDSNDFPFHLESDVFELVMVEATQNE